MHVLRFLDEALAMRPHDEIWGIQLKLIHATVLQAREIPNMTIFNAHNSCTGKLGLTVEVQIIEMVFLGRVTYKEQLTQNH